MLVRHVDVFSAVLAKKLGGPFRTVVLVVDVYQALLHRRKRRGYAEVPAAGDPPKLGPEYVAKAQPVVDEQIQKAGVRLAMTLNLALDDASAARH